jgi:hypothetical protein
MLAIFNDDINITMENETKTRKDRKIYKSSKLSNIFPLIGNVKLYEKYKKEIASIDYDLTHLLKEKNKDKTWYQLNHHTDIYVIQIKGYFVSADLDDKLTTFNITKVAIQELLNNNDILLNF